MLAYSAALNLETTFSSEISDDCHRNTRSYVSGHINLRNDHYENLRYYMSVKVFKAITLEQQ
jgi:hypothetical protein